jgi:hypothetical protein
MVENPKFELGYDIGMLRTAADCRLVMNRLREQNAEEAYLLVFRRYCEVSGLENDNPEDPIVRDFYETLAAYEQILTEKNGRTTRASRTIQKIKNKGIVQSLIEWTLGKTETNGFNLLIEKRFPKYTGEYLVVKYADRFPGDVVNLARERLRKNGIELSDQVPPPD